jgi:hypothetical protein
LNGVTHETGRILHGRTGEASIGEDETEKRSEGGRRCRTLVGSALKTFLDVVERTAKDDGTVAMDQVRRIATAFMAAEGPLTAFYARSESTCEAAFEMASIERKRVDYLGRLIANPFSHLLDVPGSGIERKHLPQFFAAVRMMMGDEMHSELKARTKLIAETHRGGDGLIAWDDFHTDPRCLVVLERVLVTIARSFRRFEPRKDWFLIMMDSTPTSVSVASNAFVPRKPEDKALRQFSDRQMVHLFESLFESVHPTNFDESRRAAFVERFGSEPQVIFGPFFVELKALANRIAA